MSVAPPTKSNVKGHLSHSYGGKKKYEGGITSSGAGEVEHLNKMLNSINVQTKKGDNGDGKLPRKYFKV